MSIVACQFIWHNKHIQIDHKSTYFYTFSNSNINFVGQLFDTDGEMKSWECIKHQFSLKNNMQFQYLQIMHALPQHWKESINNSAGNLNNLCIQDHHLIKCSAIYSLEKSNTKELYHMQLLLKFVKPTCHNYHERKFNGCNFNWKLIYRLPRIATFNSKMGIFQKKLLNNVLYLNKTFLILVWYPNPNFQSAFFMNAFIHNMYGTVFSYIYQKKLHYSFNSTGCHL